MPENGMPGPVCDLSSVRESVCIHTRKIFDSCRDKDCVEDLRFYPTASAMELLSGCQIVVVKKSRHEKYLFLICFFKSRHEEHFCGSCFFKSGHGQ